MDQFTWPRQAQYMVYSSSSRLRLRLRFRLRLRPRLSSASSPESSNAWQSMCVDWQCMCIDSWSGVQGVPPRPAPRAGITVPDQG